MFDPDRAAASLAEAPPEGPWPSGAPTWELTRSPAAARVGRLAARDGLFLFHFEHRLPLSLPDAWLDPAAADDAAPPPWRDGVLEERKYQAFRHDLLVGSFHPGHRAKWTTHELCHALVGFGWRAGATTLWHATAARLAELLPVVLWYFLDEVGLRRCPRHDGPLFRSFCPACEAAATAGPRPLGASDHEVLRDAARFLDRELAAVARTRRLGVPVPHVWGSLDLCSDGIAYATSHELRLRSEAFASWIERFCVAGGGWWSELDALEARVVEVARALAEGSEVPALAPDAASGRARWVAADLGHRLLQIHAETGGDAAGALLEVVDALADGAEVAEVAGRYRELAVAFELPPVEEVFAVGYPLPGAPGSSVAQVRAGLETVTPLALELLGDAGGAELVVEGFVADDAPARTPLGDRFAAWLATRASPAVGALVRYEAALRHAGGEPAAVRLGPGRGVRWCDGVRILCSEWDLVALAEAVEAGEHTGTWRDERLGLEPPPAEVPTALVVGRDGRGELVLAEVPAELELDAPEALPDDIVTPLQELGLLVAARW